MKISNDKIDGTSLMCFTNNRARKCNKIEEVEMKSSRMRSGQVGGYVVGKVMLRLLVKLMGISRGNEVRGVM
jgi:hypothetical protein